MSQPHYEYSAEPTRNPLRYALAVWRAIRDPSNTHEVGIVEIGFARSRFARRFAGWGDVLAALRRDPRTAARLRERRILGRIDVDLLAGLPEGSLGRVFADHCRRRGIDPNLVYVPPTTEEDWLINHLYQTHDIWHVVTGWGNDMPGEVGIGGFYVAQLHAPSFFAFLLALVNLNTALFARGTFAERMDALTVGYEAGKRAEPLFGVDWSEQWTVPIRDLREQLGIDARRTVGEGIRAGDSAGEPFALEQPSAA